jgi:pilus assembly protein Flp/PilA
MIEKLRNLVWDEEGQGMVEYGLIIALVSIVAIAALIILGGGIEDIFTNVGEKLTEESTIPGE